MYGHGDYFKRKFIQINGQEMRPEYNVPKWHYIGALHNEHS